MTNSYIPIFRSEEEYNRYQEDMIEKVVERVLEKATTPKTNEYLTRQQVAKMLNIGLTAVHDRMNDGTLIARKIKGRTLFLRSEVEEAIEKKEIFRYKRRKK